MTDISALSDILSRYPQAASELIRTTKKYNISMLRGTCNLPPTIKEIKENIYRELQISILFILKYETYLDQQSNTMRSYVISEKLSIPYINTETTINTDTYTTQVYNDNEILYGNIQLLSFKQDIDYINELIEEEKSNTIVVDIRTAYKIFSKRNNCVYNYDNYAKEETIKHFKDVCRELNTYYNILLLNMYLVMNAKVLDISTNPIFLTNPRKYDPYVNNTLTAREELYQTIIDTISDFN